MKISKNKNLKNKKKLFFWLQKIISRKTSFFLILNRCRYEILIKTKKFSFDVMISEKQEKSKKYIFSAYGKF